MAYKNPNVSFYFTHHRAWEFLSGSIIALNIIPKIKKKNLSNIIAFIGLILIIFNIANKNKEINFPDLSIISIVIGTCLILYTKESFLNGLLSFKPIAYIGVISYSIYLWHWPLFAFSNYLILRELNQIEIGYVLIITLILSIISYKYIEQPFRVKEVGINQQKIFIVVCLFLMLITLILGIFILKNEKIHSINHKSEYEWKGIKKDEQWKNFENNQRNLENLTNGQNPTLIGVNGGAPSFVIWGDSHAGSLVTVLSDLGKKYALSGYAMAHGHGTHPILGMDIYPNLGYDFDEAKYNANIINFIKQNPNLKTIIIAGFWSSNTRLVDVTGEYSKNANHELLMQVGLKRSIDKILEMKRNVVLVSDMPRLKFEPNHLNYLAKRFKYYTFDLNNIMPNSVEYSETNKNILAFFNEIILIPNVKIIHPELQFLNKKIKSEFLNPYLYVDSTHLSIDGSKFLSPAFEDLFKNMSQVNE